MAGAGKTSIGKALSLELGYEFLDTDKIIEISYGKSKDIIDSEGKDRFRVIEEEVLLSTKFNNTLLATGGSAVFSPLAMEHLCDNSDVIYLEVSFENISERVLDFKERGFIREGYWADLVLLDFLDVGELDKMPMMHKCGWSAFSDVPFRTKVLTTIVSGNIAYKNNEIPEQPFGVELEFNS
mgnify:CR=1 FL=1